VNDSNVINSSPISSKENKFGFARPGNKRMQSRGKSRHPHLNPSTPQACNMHIVPSVSPSF
jgi:hypothetical protein